MEYSKYESAAEMVKTQPKKAAAATALKRGAWTPEEDKKLVEYVRVHGDHNWRSLSEKAGLKRCGKSCRLRWLNYLRPTIKRGNITEDEEELIIRLHNLLGNKWSLITGRLPGRTDNEIKNYWNSHLRRRALSTDDLNRKLFMNPNFSSQPLQVNDTTAAVAPMRPLPVRLEPRQKCHDRCAAPTIATTVHENGFTVPASATLVVGRSGGISPVMQLSMPELIDTYEEFDGMAQLLDWADLTNQQTGAGNDVVIESQEKDGGGSLSSDGLGAWPSAWEFDDLADEDKVISHEMGDELVPWLLL